MTLYRVDPACRTSHRRRDAGVWVTVCTVLLSAVTISATGGRTSTAANRFVPSDGPPLTQYRALRRMHAKSDRFDHEAWVDAWTELDEGGFRYEIVSERGSETLRNKVLRTVLQREQAMIAAGQAERAAITDDNYTFGEDQITDDGERVVVIKPKRKEVMLVDGRMVLAPDGSLVRVEGKLAKNPSFWTSLVNIIRRFATIDGVRVPVSTESVAKVKFAGQSSLEIFCEYESINGRPVSGETKRTLAWASGRAVPQ